MSSRCREHEVNLGEVVELEANRVELEACRVDVVSTKRISEKSLSLKRLLLVVKVFGVLMNLTFTSSRKDAKKVVNVFVEEATGDRELLGLRELRELAQKGNQNWLCHTWCTH